jgi:hypothetical protein
MTFNERTHAFLSASFYRRLKAEGFHDFRRAFRMAVQLYAQQRGSRMAQRALRDGHELDFASYRAYGEWEPTEAGAMETFDVFVEGNDLKMHIYGCPWAVQYVDMGLPDGGSDYCDDLDPSITRGFNPALVYDVAQTQYFENDHCIHCQRNARLDREVPKNRAGVRPFEFHCAHLYHTFSRLMCAVYGAAGERLSAGVLEDYAAAYGQESADQLLAYGSVDFSFAD